METRILFNCGLLFVAVAGLLGACSGQHHTVEWVAADSLQTWMESEVSLVVLDTRPREAFDRAHIPGAVAIENGTVSQIRAVLPHEATGIIVVYQDGGDTQDEPPQVAQEAVEVYGFERVFRLRGGIQGWTRSGRRLDGQAVPAYRGEVRGTSP